MLLAGAVDDCVVDSARPLRLLRLISSLNPVGGGPMEGICQVTPELVAEHDVVIVHGLRCVFQLP